jgi:hypothetical protein
MATATKVDYAAQLGPLYVAPEEPQLVEVPPLQFLLIDGHGDPNGSKAYRQATDSLLAASKALELAVERTQEIGYEVMPLEGLWWIPHARVWDFADKSDWDWTLMVMQPEVVTEEMATRALAEVASARKRLAETIRQVRFQVLEEGLSAQVLHKGPCAKERSTLEILYAFVRTNGYLPTGKHHEIYLTPGAQPAAMRTIVRQPIAPMHHDDRSGPLQ